MAIVPTVGRLFSLSLIHNIITPISCKRAPFIATEINTLFVSTACLEKLQPLASGQWARFTSNAIVSKSSSYMNRSTSSSTHCYSITSHCCWPIHLISIAAERAVFHHDIAQIGISCPCSAIGWEEDTHLSISSPW